MGMTPERAVDLIVEAYHVLGGGWVRIAHIAKKTGLSKADLHAGIRLLLRDCDNFRVDPEPLGRRLTAEDKEWAVLIGGDNLHVIRFY